MSGFFAYMARLRLIRRWALMRNTQPENDAEHSLQVAMIAHALAVWARDRYGREVNPEHVVTLAVYHDAAEVLTGDMPTPVKYSSAGLRAAFRQVEEAATGRLLAMLPASLRADFAAALTEEESDSRRLVRAADKLSAYVKCLEEQRAGNHEFDAAAVAIRASLNEMNLPEVDDFLRECVPAFSLTLDELNAPGAQNAEA
ncbi:MAG: 5'-deoxynucleotidase [Clostridia bacterium]|nr:5'-deoxynucleotidase [Clostridia bacterium]